MKEQRPSSMNDWCYRSLNEAGEAVGTIGFITSATISSLEGIVSQNWDTASKLAGVATLFLVAIALAQENQSQQDNSE